MQSFWSQVHGQLGLQPNPDQVNAVQSPASLSLFLVAGPGSGKTTVLALRALKLVFVDGLEPGSIVATTFTRRAAKELRSRILGWGDDLRRSFLGLQALGTVLSRLLTLDFNAIITGTLDSVAETILSQYKAPATAPPTVIEEFASQALMLRQGLFPGGRFRNSDLKDYITRLTGSTWGLSPASMSEIVQFVRERFVHDFVDVAAYRTSSRSCLVCPQHPHSGIPIMCDAIQDYESVLQAEGVFDYSDLESAFFQRLIGNQLAPFQAKLRALLVDEYQDTNLLQESIYFSLARGVVANDGGVTVVGDDDQSLFRFRGATVDLFQAYSTRIVQAVGVAPTAIFLASNYRSTQAIVDFCNDFATLDARYQPARVVGKPPIARQRNVNHNPPILGMFRDTVDDLARDLSQLIHAVFAGSGAQIPGVGLIQRALQGSVGDCALLCHSPAEVRGDRLRLPHLLREHLGKLAPPIQVFNPRGEHLASVLNVQLLCGLILECVDRDAAFQNGILNLPQEAVVAFNRWRLLARAFISQDPPPHRPRNLQTFVATWQTRNNRGQWTLEASLAELAYKLVTWIEGMQNDIEGLVHLEVVLRTIIESSQFSRYAGHILFRDTNVEQASIRAMLWDILVPLALGAVEIDEDLLETLPKDRLNILSVHQAKGLEFPMVVVDVGSDFKINSQSQAFSRYPLRGDLTHNLEDELHLFSPMTPPTRGGRDRAFDDLTRLYFVAYSRAVDVLLLVGLNAVKNRIPHVATGWTRDAAWQWGSGLPNLLHI